MKKFISVLLLLSVVAVAKTDTIIMVIHDSMSVCIIKIDDNKSTDKCYSGKDYLIVAQKARESLSSATEERH